MKSIITNNKVEFGTMSFGTFSDPKVAIAVAEFVDENPVGRDLLHNAIIRGASEEWVRKFLDVGFSYEGKNAEMARP